LSSPSNLRTGAEPLDDRLRRAVWQRDQQALPSRVRHGAGPGGRDWAVTVGRQRAIPAGRPHESVTHDQLLGTLIDVIMAAVFDWSACVASRRCQVWGGPTGAAYGDAAQPRPPSSCCSAPPAATTGAGRRRPRRRDRGRPSTRTVRTAATATPTPKPPPPKTSTPTSTCPSMPLGSPTPRSGSAASCR